MRSLLSITAILFAVIVNAQTIIIPLDTNSVTIDGSMNVSEWQHARASTIKINVNDSIAVYYKYYQGSIYIAFTGKLESANSLFPEILIDVKNKRGVGWVNDQWWLHVSATDCEHNGAYGIYDNCKVIQPGWEAAPNFSSGNPITDTVEIKVPFAKVGFDINTMDTIGLAFVATNTATVFKLFPQTADRNKPETWAKAIFSKTMTNVKMSKGMDMLKLYPNPVKTELFLNGLVAGDKVVLYDAIGRTLQRLVVNEKVLSINMEDLIKGTYFIEVSNADSNRKFQKVVKQ